MKLIPLDAVLAEIKRRMSENEKKQSLPQFFGMLEEDLGLTDFINSLEVREVDLEDSIKESLAQKYIDYTFKRHNIDPESKEGQLIYYAYMHGMNQCLDQLRTKKGE